MKVCRRYQIEGYVLKYRVHPLWRTYIGERRTTFAKTYGIKVRCYEEHVREHIRNMGNILRTYWEPEGNIVGTHWEPTKNEKKILLPPSPHKKKRKKKQGALSACLGLPIGCMAFLFPKEFVTIFGLG